MAKPYASNDEVARNADLDPEAPLLDTQGRHMDVCYKGDHAILYDKEEAERLATLWGTEAKCVPPRFANSSWDHFCIVRLP